MISSFTILAVSLNATGAFLGLDGEQAKTIAAVALILFGLMLIGMKLPSRVKSISSGLANKANMLLQKWTPKGLSGQFVVGAFLGAMWMPCAGPAFGAAITLAAQGKNLSEATIMMLIFGIGAALPLLAVAYGGRRIFSGKAWLVKVQKNGEIVFGLILISFGVLALTGRDKMLEATMVNAMPEWLINVTTKY